MLIQISSECGDLWSCDTSTLNCPQDNEKAEGVYLL